MIDFDGRYKITKQERYARAEEYVGVHQKRLFSDTYISQRLPLLKYSNLTTGKINSFIKEVNIDCLSGAKITMDGAVEPYCLRFNGECVGYVTQVNGESSPISDVAKEFLFFCKPEAVVSKEGILLFYYDMNIVSTISGKEWCFISLDTEWAEQIVQKEIECIDNVFSNHGKTVIRFKMTDGSKEEFELKLDLEFTGIDCLIQGYLSKEDV